MAVIPYWALLPVEPHGPRRLAQWCGAVGPWVPYPPGRAYTSFHALVRGSRSALNLTRVRRASGVGRIHVSVPKAYLQFKSTGSMPKSKAKRKKKARQESDISWGGKASPGARRINIVLGVIVVGLAVAGGTYWFLGAQGESAFQALADQGRDRLSALVASSPNRSGGALYKRWIRS